MSPQPPQAAEGTACSAEGLLARIGRGDAVAMEALYDEHSPVLYAVALRIVGDRAEAEDVLHDAFVLVAERALQYDHRRGTVASWLVTIVRNLGIDRVRRRQRRGQKTEQVLAHEPAPPQPTPETLTSAAAGSSRIRRALATLPEVQRATLEIAFFDGLSYSEIAERENVPVGTIKSRAARALAALREALAREGVTEPW
ncbi:MAG: sigma-70 family RNA polymerase sigma factor [Myxococcales bacterium]|nr:sigma-70 family RNA polymerase sigma factor [Myxococcales bacterium]